MDAGADEDAMSPFKEAAWTPPDVRSVTANGQFSPRDRPNHDNRGPSPHATDAAGRAQRHRQRTAPAAQPSKPRQPCSRAHPATDTAGRAQRLRQRNSSRAQPSNHDNRVPEPARHGRRRTCAPLQRDRPAPVPPRTPRLDRATLPAPSASPSWTPPAGSSPFNGLDVSHRLSVPADAGAECMHGVAFSTVRFPSGRDDAG